METNQKLSLVQQLEATATSQIVNLPEVAAKFKRNYSVFLQTDEAQSQLAYEAEKFHFAKLINDNAAIKACTKMSLFGVFLDMAANGLSFDPGMKHVYVVAFPANVGTKDNPKWEKRATLMVSGPGELVLRMRAGQIRYADNPVLIYEGDHFQHGTKDGKVFLEHVATFPRATDTIIGCYIRLERMDGSVDYKVISMDEVMKLRKFSKDPNSKAWTDGLPGMIQSKCIKHAFRSYPRIKATGMFTQLSTNVLEAPIQIEPQIDYGLNGSTPSEQPKIIITNVEDNDFVTNTNARVETVVVESEDF